MGKESVWPVLLCDKKGKLAEGSIGRARQPLVTCNVKRSCRRSCREYIIDTFVEDKEGYWYNWREMFDATLLEREFFEHYSSNTTLRTLR